MKQAFINTIEKHQGIIFKVSKMYRDTKQDQEDLYQEIVLQLWRAYPGFKKQSKISTWMYRIALNTAIAVFRKKKVALEFKAELPPTVEGSQGTESSENQEKMFAAFRTLNKAERAVIALFLEDYSYREMAEILGISEQYVAVKISRIKVKLKEILSETIEDNLEVK